MKFKKNITKWEEDVNINSVIAIAIIVWKTYF